MATEREERDVTMQEEKSSSGSKRGRNRRRNRGGKQSGERKSSGINGVSFGSQLAYDVTNLPFDNSLGREVEVFDSSRIPNPTYDVDSDKYVTPGLCVFDMYPGIGEANSQDSAVNLAAKNYYNTVTQANSRDRSYGPNDLMIHALAVTELFKLWNWGATAYGLVKQYDAMNRYKPEVLVQAMGFNVNDLMINLNDFRGALNLIAMKVSSVVLPAGMPYTTMNLKYFTNIFADSMNSRAQLYMFKPAAYWVYDETAEETGGSLQLQTLPSNMTTSQFITLLNNLVNRILSSNYMNIMSADIIKAFGSNLLALSEIPAEYTVVPVYSDEILESINNLKIMRAPNGTGTSDGRVVQIIPDNTNVSPYLTCAPMFESATEAYKLQLASTMKTSINTGYDTLSPDQVVYRTEFAARWHYFGNAGKYFRIHARTLYCTAVTVYTYSARTGVQSFQIHSSVVDASTLSYAHAASISAFNKFPLLYMCDEAKSAFVGVFGDVDNIAWVDRNDMSDIDDAVVNIEFGTSFGSIRSK